CLVSYAGNYYSVPAAYACQALVVKETDSGELLILSAQGELLATHRVLVGRRQRSIQAAHYAGLTLTGARRNPPTAIQDTVVVVPFGNLPPLPQVEIRPLSVYDALAGGDR
ncbi:MAG: Mu transposase domain-containing protein, partial [Aggregatilineales bacterium]